MKKIYKKTENTTFYGSNRSVEIKPLTRFEDSSFYHYGRRYRLSQFMRFNNAPDDLKEFDGYYSDSYFSGIVVKLSNDGETLKAFTYIY